jgi:predicted phosphoribosyltransferase
MLTLGHNDDRIRELGVYFSNRIDLGRTMAQKLPHLRAKDVIILCLKENSLSTSIGLASELRGWIYPLLIAPIVIPGDGRTLGAINQDGELCYNPKLSRFEREEIEMDNASVIQDASREAFSLLNRQTAEYGDLSKDGLNGRTVVLCADILRDQIEIAAATEFLKSVETLSIVGIVGNITTDVADILTVSSQDSEFMDVLTNMFDDDHYFEQPETYSIEERRQLAMNISNYWV